MVHKARGPDIGLALGSGLASGLGLVLAPELELISMMALVVEVEVAISNMRYRDQGS